MHNHENSSRDNLVVCRVADMDGPDRGTRVCHQSLAAGDLRRVHGRGRKPVLGDNDGRNGLFGVFIVKRKPDVADNLVVPYGGNWRNAHRKLAHLGPDNHWQTRLGLAHVVLANQRGRANVVTLLDGSGAGSLGVGVHIEGVSRCMCH